MTKKHYEAIAEVINDVIRPYDERAVQNLVYDVTNDLADYFESDNPRFDRDRFLTACGIMEEDRTDVEIEEDNREDIAPYRQ